MKRKISVLALAAVALLIGSAARAQDFYVIAGGGPPVGTKITSLPYTINNSGFYFLGSDLGYTPTTGNAITINHNDVTLDLMGFILVGPGPNTDAEGIHISPQYNVEVRNGTVAGFRYGINEINSNAANCRILNIRAANNFIGINMSGLNHLIKNCTATANTAVGIGCPGSGLITDNVASNNGSIGISLVGPGSLLGNTACNNSLANFVMGNGGADSILVDRNSAFGSN